MATSVVIGAALSSGFFGATRRAERRAARLGETWKRSPLARG